MKKHNVDDVINKVAPPERVIALEAENARVRKLYSDYKKEHGKLEQLMSEVLSTVKVMEPTRLDYSPRCKDKSDASSCSLGLHLTDVHYGAIQEADEVEGFGQYSPAISERRQMGLIKGVLDWTEMHRKGYLLPECRVLCTGDFVSGDIHEELRITNAFPAPVQAVEEARILSQQIAMLAPHFSSIVVDFITDDNHGRLTRKPQCKESGLNNWGYIVSNVAKKTLSLQKNVTFNIWPMAMKSVTVCNRRYLLTHGNNISGWGGIPFYGIERMTAREATKRMNGPDFTKFHRIIMGHFHAPMQSQYYWIGGSVSGTDAYDHKCGRHARPQQVSWIIHPAHGEFDCTNWYLDEFDNK